MVTSNVRAKSLLTHTQYSLLFPILCHCDIRQCPDKAIYQLLSRQNILYQFCFISFSEILSSPVQNGLFMQSFRVKYTWVPLLTLLLTSCVTWGPLLNFSSHNLLLILWVKKQRTRKKLLNISLMLLSIKKIHLAWLLQGMKRHATFRLVLSTY